MNKYCPKCSEKIVVVSVVSECWQAVRVYNGIIGNDYGMPTIGITIRIECPSCLTNITHLFPEEV